ncbi:hypothetical protein [Saccharopolyspora antimicrobica]|uniref:hypothetical protein n=1 Tax=Saccharopolyspora antimicrobica TaxID=455193 RepID=UPI000B866722|nr:hypothetical protein [Saccharopolyspora antimicrobica]
MAAVLVPWGLMAGGVVLSNIDRDGALGWVGIIVGLIGAVYSTFYWGKFSNSDGIARVRLSPLAWVARIVGYALALGYLLVAAVFLFV